jgi:tripartite-type tricarboxylate transporter receptor subunit TctC
MSAARFAVLGRLGLAVLASALFSGAAAAQAWPTKPVTIVQGFPAGSGIDIIARIIQGPLEKALGTTIVFDYKAGAGGNLASEFVAKAAPDGYTFVFGTAGTHGINATLYKKLNFDVEADFTPIAPVVDVPNVLTINPKIVDAKDVKEFIAIVKKQPGKLNYGSSGNGASTHLGFAQFNVAAGLEMVHIPYKGSPPAIQAMPGFESVTWYGILGPKGIDPAIASKFNAAIKTVLEDKEIVAKLAGIGNAVRYETVDQFRATIKKDRAQWAEVVKKSGATVD